MGRQRSQTTVPGGAQEERVAGYLLEHPGFFDRHPETLLKLELCRRTVGRVASLVERQVARLRERNRELEGRLGDLLEAAGDNERLVERIHRLTIGLLAPSSAAQRIGILHRRLKRDFEVERAALILFAAPADVQPDNGFVRIVDRRDPGLKVCDNAEVFGRAQVYGNAQVFGNANVSGDVLMCDRAHVSGRAHCLT